jgi:hypothetical protein
MIRRYIIWRNRTVENQQLRRIVARANAAWLRRIRGLTPIRGLE